MHITKWLFILALIMFSCDFFAEAQSELAQNIPGPVLIDESDATVEVTVLEDGNWHVAYTFKEAQTELLFRRSRGDYRRQNWQPVVGMNTPHVRREYGNDVLRFDSPQKQAAFTVIPYTERIQREYTPFLLFSNGDGAMFLDQFAIDPIQADAQDQMVERSETLSIGVRIISDKPVLLKGEVFKDTNTEYLLADDAQTYAYIGAQDVSEGESYVGIVDPALPEWLQNTFDEDLSRIFAVLEQNWGMTLPEKATLYFAYGGSERSGFSFSGSVAGGDTIVLRVSGKALIDPDENTRRRILEFFAHESVHVFQGAGQVQIGATQQAWWHEGSADTMALDVLIAFGLADPDFISNRYRQRIDRCGLALEERPLIGQPGRLPYQCGDVIATLFEAALPGQTLYDVWRDFIFETSSDLEHDDIDERVFEILAAANVSQTDLSTLESLIREKQAMGRTALLKAYEQMGVAYTLDEYGSIETIEAR